MWKPALAYLLIVPLALMSLEREAAAQGWDLFGSFDGSSSKKPEQEQAPVPAERRGPDTVMTAPLNDSESAVERSELAPVMATDGSGLPFELWKGLDVGRLEELISELEIPPRSPALHALWQRLITSSVSAPDGGETDQHFMALRLETLYRSGLLEEASREVAKMSAGTPLVATLAARNEIGLGQKDQGCATAKSGGPPGGDMPKPLRGEAILISGYCAAVGGDAAGAGLAAELAREEGVKDAAGLAALEAISAGGKPSIAHGDRISLIDYRLIEASGGAVDVDMLLKSAAPSLLAALALDSGAEPDLKLRAGEAAAQVNAITPDELAALYRARAGSATGSVGLDEPREDGVGGAQRRAGLFVAAEFERTPQKKVRLIRSFLDAAHRAGLYMTALRMIAPAAESVVEAPEIGWFAETGIEVALASGNYERARRWAAFGSGPDGPGGHLGHWLALADIADSGPLRDRGASLSYVEDLAERERLDPTLLHRLATVLDALEYNVPIPLWEAASRTSQPAGGYLPETGVLSELQDAAKKREFGRTVLLTMKTLGPDGPEGANMLALGDSIRALKRAGLEGDARQLGFEALFATWPRTITN